MLYFKDRPNTPGTAPVVGRHYVSSRYFPALGIQLRRGRLLTDDDRAGRPAGDGDQRDRGEAVLAGRGSDRQARLVRSAPGFTDPARPVEIVGVVADVKYWPINDAVGPDFYTSYLQFTYPSSLYLDQGARNAAAVVPALRRAVADDRSDAADLRRAAGRRARRRSGGAAAVHRDGHGALRDVDGAARRDGRSSA